MHKWLPYHSKCMRCARNGTTPFTPAPLALPHRRVGKVFSYEPLVGVLAIGVVPVSAGAFSFTISSNFPIDLVVFVPCAAGGAGEDVALSGTLHDLFHVTVNSANTAHFKMTENPQGISGVGLTTGTKYQGTGMTQGEFNVRLGSQDTFISNFRIIGPGPGNNFLLHQNLHVTVNANGTVTAFVDNFRADCK